MALKHTFVSAIADGADATLVRPSNWNADHSIDLDGLVIPVDTVDPLPGAQTGSNVRLYNSAKNVINQPASVSSKEFAYALQNFTGEKHVAVYRPASGVATAPGISGFSMTPVGTATARLAANTSTATLMKRIGYVSSATAGSLASVKHLSPLCRTGDGSSPLLGFLMVNRFVISDAATVTGARMAVGLTSSIVAATNVEPSTLTNGCVMAQLSTDATQLYVCFGGTTAQTPVALGATNFPVSTTIPYEFTCYSSPIDIGVINWQAKNLANGATVTGTTGSNAVTSPASVNLLSNYMWRTNNATALAVGLDVGLIYLETPF